jgi:uncharacterized protein YndB with AHSA1/START domain
MERKNNNATIAATKTVTIKRKINLPVDLVWRAWTEPETIMKWWGPKGYTCPYCSVDLKPGGSYLYDMRTPDGKDTWGTGTYKEIIPRQKLAYTDSFADSDGNIVSSTYYDMPEMPLEVPVTVQFTAAGDATEMLLQHEGIPEEIYEDCIKGWQSSFDKLEAI